MSEPLLYFLLGAVLSALLLMLFYLQKRAKWQATQALLEHKGVEQQLLLSTKEEALEAERSRRREQIEEQQKSFERQLQEMDHRFAALSEEITKRRSEELTTTNKAHLDALLSPLKEQVEGMKQAFEAGKLRSAEQSGDLHRAIKELMAQAVEIGSKADNLSTALRGKGKIQGDWGEAKLQSLLDAEGLIMGEQYSVQHHLTDGSGRAYRPDFIIYYPDNKALVVDSKVSLTAYADYYEATNESSKAERAEAHLKSLKTHIQQLARKEYAKLIEQPLESLDFVILFVPIHNALQLALTLDPTLWRTAMEKGILLASESSIMALLKMVHLAWRQYNTDRNMEEITKQGELMLKRVSDFYATFENLGNRLQQLQRAYSDTDTKLRGNQGILTSARKLSELGIKNSSTHPLPPV